MKITLIQADLYWENVERNRNHLYHLIKEFATGSDIVLLPEFNRITFTVHCFPGNKAQFDYRGGFHEGSSSN